MHKDEIKAMTESVFEALPILRKIQFYADVAYETVPFLCAGTIHAAILQFRALRVSCRIAQSLSNDREAFESAFGVLDAQIAQLQRALEVWRLTGSVEAVRESQYESIAQRYETLH